MPTVFANGRSILHAGHGSTHIAAPPDVCKTPSPGGPIPIPYVNIAKDGDLAKGTKTIKIEGHPVAIESSNLSTSTGDEPGTAGGGIISSKTKGKLTWASVSPDVKYEGKGVVRFMDVTQHNGNTFNTAFISQGGTGFAYADDKPCEVCNKDADAHRVLETPEVAAMASAVIFELDKLMKSQRPIIKEYARLKAERNALDNKYKPAIDKLDSQIKPLQLRQKLLIADPQNNRAQLGEVQAALKSLQAELQALKTKKNSEKNILLQRMEAENAKLAGTHVLRKDDSTGTYTMGYMIGALVCRCPSKPKKLAASSTVPTPGFRTAVSNAGFTLVSAFTMSDRQAARVAKLNRKWTCAAPKLLQAGGANGHKVASISERWYSPMGSPTSLISFQKDGQSVKQVFESGETVPSCELCQELVPEMVCDNNAPCA